MTKRATKPDFSLPTIPLDDHVFKLLAHEFDKVVNQMRAGDSHRHMRLWMRLRVYNGSMTLRRLIELTTDKEASIDADAALRDIAAEFLERKEELPQLLAAYVVCHPSRPEAAAGARATIGCATSASLSLLPSPLNVGRRSST